MTATAIREVSAGREIIGGGAAIHEVLRLVEIVAPTASTVLILGETGTGKELIARAIHEKSPRRDRAFLKVNCAALPSGLLESELFGHERGAFTGAVVQKMGRFEAANGGTIFLDEIGDIPTELQPKLLRVLQEQEFERLGSNRALHTDVRIVAATNQDLAGMIAERRFRADLFYRLSVFPLSLPPLRQRPDDIPLLVRHFVMKFAERLGRRIETIHSDVMQALVRYPWPGNVRELQNYIERSVILSLGPVLEVRVGELLDRNPEAFAPNTLKGTERAAIVRALFESNGQLTRAAVMLGVPRTTLFYKLRRLGIALPQTTGKPDTADCFPGSPRGIEGSSYDRA